MHNYESIIAKAMRGRMACVLGSVALGTRSRLLVASNWGASEPRWLHPRLYILLQY